MQDNHRARLSFIHTGLPWVVAAVALVLYAITLNRWVSLDSLPFVSKVTGWDWTLPYQTPLFFVLTYPIRWLPMSIQPVCLNFFTAICAVLSLALLARSVTLLPHDRTHEQRQRERSEFSLLSVPSAWLPPVLAALVCGLELTFWEHATAATNEALDLLVFAYVIRCLLEYRVSQRESWLLRMSFVYGLGVTNNAAMIGYFPCVLVAVFWIKGMRFFDFRFCIRMLGCGLLGLSLYLVLPLAWAASDNQSVSFAQALRAHLSGQKAMLELPGLRNRVLVLSLTSLLPLVIIGLRWPASFGDTSAAGAALSRVMFRVIHSVFLIACIWVAFDQQFSPRTLGGNRVPFLTFYYMGALSIGYFSGYLLLVFGEARTSKSWHRRSGVQLLLNKVVVTAVFLALIAVPAALIVKNWKNIRTTNGPLLAQLGELSSKALPQNGAIVMSDDPYGVLLLSASLSREGSLSKYILVHTRSLLSPDYHQQLHKKYPNRWPTVFTNQPPDEIIDDGSLSLLLRALSRSNDLYYLHPSFGYYFESFYLQPHGLVYQMTPYATNVIFPPALTTNIIAENDRFWTRVQGGLGGVAAGARVDSRDLHYIGGYYSRALNYWGVALQRNQHVQEARQYFQKAVELDTNNVPAQSNLEFNHSLQTGQPRAVETGKSMEEKFAIFRGGWEPMLLADGPFDHPDFCMRLGRVFAQQGLFRQSIIQWDRVRTLEPTNILATLALADVYLSAHLPARALEEVAKIRSGQGVADLPQDVVLELARLEGVAQLESGKQAEAERFLQETFAKYPKSPGILDPLLQLYAQTDRLKDAFSTAERIIRADPDRAQSYINQAALYLKVNDPTNALASVDGILQKFPNQPDALLYKIFILIQSKDYPKAKAAVESLLSVEPENIEGLLNQAVVDVQTKNFQEALKPLEKVLAKQPNNATALRYRAFTYTQLNDLSKAEKDYNTLRRLAARDYVYVAYWGLGEIAFRRHDSEEARKYYNLYLQYAPTQESPDLQEEKKIVRERLNTLGTARR